MQWIDRGEELPLPKTPLYKKFVKAWRGWYEQYCNVKFLNSDHVVARNKFYYDFGKEHLEKAGVVITEIPESGSVQAYLPEPFGFADDNEVERAFSYAIS